MSNTITTTTTGASSPWVQIPSTTTPSTTSTSGVILSGTTSTYPTTYANPNPVQFYTTTEIENLLKKQFKNLDFMMPPDDLDLENPATRSALAEYFKAVRQLKQAYKELLTIKLLTQNSDQ